MRTIYRAPKRAALAGRRSPRAAPARTRQDLERLTAQLEAELARPRRDFKALLKLWKALTPLEVAGRAGRKRCCLVCRVEPMKGCSPPFVRHREGCEVAATVLRALNAVEALIRPLVRG